MDNNNKNWVCPHCFQVNKVGTTICTNCSGDKSDKGIFENNFKNKWVCPKCQQINDIEDKYCGNCEKINPALPDEEKQILRAERERRSKRPIIIKKTVFYSIVGIFILILLFICFSTITAKAKISRIVKEYNAGNYETAYNLINEIYEDNVRDPEINRLLIETNSKRAELFVEEGKALFKEGKKEEALAKAEEALAIRYDYEEAKELITAIRKTDLDGYVEDALKLLSEGKDDEALAIIEDAINLDPNNENVKAARRKIRAKVDGSTFSGFDLAKKEAKYDADNEEFKFSLAYKNNSQFHITKAVMGIEIVNDSGDIVKTAQGEILDLSAGKQKDITIIVESEIKYTQYRINILSVEYE